MPDNNARNSTRMGAASRYALALAIALFGIVLRVWLTPLLGDRNRYHAAWAAVAFCAWYCGLGPSVVAALVSAFGIWFWFAPDSSQVGLYRMEFWGTVGFLLFSALIIALGETARRSKTKAERTETTLRESEEQLRQLNQNMAQEIERRTSELAQKTAQTVEQANLLNLANDAIFVRDLNGEISYWNQGAERLYGWTSAEAVGRQTHDLLRTIFPVPLEEIAASDLWEGELVHFKRDGTQITVASRWTALRDDQGNFKGWLEICTDVTARKQLEESARRLMGRILNLQDHERRRIARELHDSLGQYLASIKVNLDLLSQIVSDPHPAALISDCIQSAEQSLVETRTLSHLLHPPLLDEAGFAFAARWYVEGFAQRSGLSVDLDLPPEFERMSGDVETALFRILQEALTNVHRHAGGSQVRVQLRVDDKEVRLEITDNGRGIPRERLRRMETDRSVTGVGLAGMRERVRELGGSLKVLPASPGTRIVATIPIDQATSPVKQGSSEGAPAA